MNESEQSAGIAEQYIFCLKIAGLLIGIRTGRQKVKLFFEEYIMPDVSSEDCDFVVEASEAKMKDVLSQLTQFQKREKIPDWYLEELTLFTMIAERIPFYGVLLIHGSAIAVDGQGFLFTAPSGTGKSTHATLWRSMLGERVEMINDDKPFLICREEGIFVCGTPWMGKHRLGTKKEVPLKAIALLHQDKTNHMEQVSIYQIFESLYQQIFHDRSNIELTKKTLALMEKIARHVQFYELYCNMDPEAAEIAYKVMNMEKIL